MSPDVIAIIGVGVALASVMLSIAFWLDRRVERRIERMEDLWEQRFTTMDERWEQRFTALDNRMDRFEDRMDRFEDRVDQRFNAMEERFQRLEQGQARMEGELALLREFFLARATGQE